LKVWAFGKVANNNIFALSVNIPKSESFGYDETNSSRIYIEKLVSNIIKEDFILIGCEKVQEEYDEW
jgi:hypothetical protein